MNKIALKAQSLIDLAEQHLGLSFTSHDLGVWQTCPACHGKSKFIVNPDQTYKCISPNCELNQKGDIFDLCRIRKGWRFSQVCNFFQIESRSHSPSPKNLEMTEYYRLTQQNLRQSPEALLFLEEKYGLTPETLPLDLDIGYTLASTSRYALPPRRLVFPIRDKWGNIQHLHTRSIELESSLRWLPTQTDDNLEGLSFGRYLWNIHKHYNAEHLILTEGIGDGLLTELNLGLPVVSLLSIMTPICDLLKDLPHLKTLVIVLDNDKTPLTLTGTNLTKFKSWDVAIEGILKLNTIRPSLKVWCVYPPRRIGVKDLGDWIQREGVTKQEFLDYVKRMAKHPIQFFFEHYWEHLTKHPSLIGALAFFPEFKGEYHNRVIQGYGDWVSYTIKLHDLHQLKS